MKDNEFEDECLRNEMNAKANQVSLDDMIAVYTLRILALEEERDGNES